MLRLVPLYFAFACALACFAAGQDPPPAREPAAPSATTAAVEAAIADAMSAIDELEEAETELTRDELFEEVNRRIAAIAAMDSANPRLSFLAARTSAAMGRAGDAIDQMQKFVETREGRNEWRAYRILGDLFVAEFPRLAKANYEKAAELEPNDPGVLFGLSVAASKIGQRDEALDLAQRAVERDGRQTVRYLANLASLLTQAGRWPEAIETAMAAVRRAESEVLDAPGRMTPLRTLDGQYALFIQILRRRTTEETAGEAPTSALAPREMASLSVQLADAIEKRGDVAVRTSAIEALRALETAVSRTEPDPPKALLHRYAVALVEAGREEDAMSVFQRILATDPNDVAAAEWIRRLSAPADSAPSQVPDNGGS